MWLTLIRHAEPAYVVEGVAYTDPPLTDRGRVQAQRLGERVAGWDVDELWVSPMVRARQTVGPVAAALGCDPVIMGWLAEIQNPPAWDGSPADEVEAYFAQERSVEAMWDGIPGGESFRDFHQRVHGGLSATMRERGMTQTSAHHLWTGIDDRRVVVVAHGGSNALILCHLLGVDPVPWEWDRFTHVHSGVSRLVSLGTAGSHSWSLRSLSDRTHLDSDMVTS